jgi:phosphoribosylglycinamide formyltransferase-1
LKKRIAIFASGSGSNAQKIMEHFKRNADAEVVLILTNNPQAYVLQRADNFEIPSHIFTRAEFYDSDDVIVPAEKPAGRYYCIGGFPVAGA